MTPNSLKRKRKRRNRKRKESIQKFSFSNVFILIVKIFVLNLIELSD